ncbi:MAG: hypothetical protein JW750_06180 [Anaerolineaceae bacterium]|nr:hypothetical protein [Anaerolineaceae bacterium]
MSDLDQLIELFEDADDQALSHLGVHLRKKEKGIQKRGSFDVQSKHGQIQTNQTANQDLLEEGFEFTYQPSRHEEQWLFSSLAEFYVDHWFDDILRIVKGGKEASVYLCRAHETVDAPYLAAKVYRPRKFRNLRNDHLYREGRERLDDAGHIIHDDRMLKAIHLKTSFGKELMHTSWLAHEKETMERLHAAGCDVPRIYASSENTILMDYIGDELGGAPTLQEVDLEKQEAKMLFERVVDNIDKMLQVGRVHGDLSAYNILYWAGEITLIDFPQAISPDQNQSAYRIFRRDVQRICEYFARQGVRTDYGRLADDLWTRYYRIPDYSYDPMDLDEA